MMKKTKSILVNQRQKLAIAVARVSTNSQIDSLEVQTNIITNYCKNHPELKFEGQIFDLHESAYCLGVKKLDEIIQTIPANSAILFNKVDRFSRNVRDFNICSDLINKKNIEIHFIAENIIWNKNTDRETENKINGLLGKAEGESIEISKRVKDVNKLNRTTYHKISYNAPLGYINYQEGRSKGWKLNKSTARLVKHMFEAYATGKYSIAQISEKAFSERLIGRQTSNQKLQKPLCKQSVINILTNPFYIGFAKYGKNLYKHKYPKLISKELFDKCQQIYKSKTKSSVHEHTNKTSAYFGLIRNKETNKLYTPYCTKGYNYLKAPSATEKDLKESVFDKIILDNLGNFTQYDDLPANLQKELNKEKVDDSTQITNNITMLTKQKQEKENKIQELLINPPATATKDMIEKAINQLNNMIQNIEEKIKANTEAKDQISPMIKVKDLVSCFKNSNNPVRAKILSYFFEKITYSSDGNVVLYYQSLIQEEYNTPRYTIYRYQNFR